MSVDAEHAEQPEPPPSETSQTSPRHSSFLKELPVLVVISIGLALLIKTFLVQAFYIPSGSMEDTLQVRDRVLVNKLVYDTRSVRRGEVVVFKGPEGWAPEVTYTQPSNPVSRLLRGIGSALGVGPAGEKDFIKRVIGVGGDHVVCCDADGRITVNGAALDEPYLYPDDRPSTTPFDVVVPKNRLWVMGDHRGDSADSRAHDDDAAHGTVPVGNVIGRAFVVVWPPGNWRKLPVPSTFHQKQLDQR